MTIPEQESPAVLHALQMQVADLESDFEQVATLPGKLRQLERDLSALKEDVSALKQPSLGETDSEHRSTALHSSTLESGGDGEPTTQAGDSPRVGDAP